MKIVFINKTLMSGGIEKCIELLSKSIYKNYEVEIYYQDDHILDPEIVNILKQYANVYKFEDNTTINCNIIIWCSLYFDYQNMKSQINAKRQLTWIHSMPRILPDCLLDNQEYIDDNEELICVSKAVQNHLNIDKKSRVIHNFIDENIHELANAHNPFKGDNNTLKLCTVSRLSEVKGFDRFYLLCEGLKKHNIPFEVKVVGKGRLYEPIVKEKFKVFDNVEFVGLQKNPFPYIKNSDYLIQLSDDESWCNSITEAKALHTPVVVTNFESSKEQITDNENGIVIDLLETNYEQHIERIINQKEKLRNNLKDFQYKNDIDSWLNLFNK